MKYGHENKPTGPHCPEWCNVGDGPLHAEFEDHLDGRMVRWHESRSLEAPELDDVAVNVVAAEFIDGAGWRFDPPLVQVWGAGSARAADLTPEQARRLAANIIEAADLAVALQSGGEAR